MLQNQNEDTYPSNDTQNVDDKASENVQNIIPDIININLNEAKDEKKEPIEDEKEVEEKVKEVIDNIIEDEENKEVMEEMKWEVCEESDIDSDDEDKWIPKYKDCPCCYGFVYKCKGKICASLRQCFCKMKDEIEEEEKHENNNDNE